MTNSLDNVIGTQQSAYEATLQYQYWNINIFLIYALFTESSIDTFGEICILHNIKIKIAVACLLLRSLNLIQIYCQFSQMIAKGRSCNHLHFDMIPKVY